MSSRSPHLDKPNASSIAATADDLHIAPSLLESWAYMSRIVLSRHPRAFEDRSLLEYQTPQATSQLASEYLPRNASYG